MSLSFKQWLEDTGEKLGQYTNADEYPVRSNRTAAGANIFKSRPCNKAKEKPEDPMPTCSQTPEEEFGFDQLNVPGTPPLRKMSKKMKK